MLIDQLHVVTPKRRGAAEPFVHHHAQGILIAGGPSLLLNLLRGHVDGGAASLLLFPGFCTVSKGCNAKITQQDVVIWPQQNVLRLDIAMDALVIMRILQGPSYLIRIDHYGVQGQACSLRMTSAQGAIGGIGDDQERGIVLANAKSEKLGNVGMLEIEGAGFIDELSEFLHHFLEVDVVSKVRLDHFDGSESLVMDMLAQVDLAEGALS